MNNDLNLANLQNEDIFRIVVEQSATPMVLYAGIELTIKLANPAALKAWKKDNSVIGKTHSEALPELESQPFRNLLQQVFSTGIAYEAKDAPVDLMVDGRLQTCFFDFTYRPLFDADGKKVWGVLNTAADVTELVRMRKKLSESEERTRFALQAAGLGTWDYNVAEKIINWDEKCKELYGFSKNEFIIYPDILKYIHPYDKELANRDVQTALNAELGGNYYSEFRVQNAETGQTTWLRCKGKAYFDNNGEAYRFGGTAQDISAEIGVKEVQQRLNTVVENSPDMIGTADLNGNITYMNKAGLNLVGADNLKDAQRPAVEFLMEKDAIVFQNEGIPSIRDTGRWSGELSYRHFKTGKPIPCFVTVFLINDENTGKPGAMAAVVRDLRPDKAAHNEQYKLLSLIENSSDFVSLSDLDGYISYVNVPGMQMLGIDLQNSSLRHTSVYLAPEETQQLSGEVNRELFEKGKWTGQLNYRHFKTGENIPVYATTMLVYDAATGKPQGRASIARDLRREIADKKALMEQKEQFEFVTNFMPQQVWTAGTDGLLDFVNKQIKAYFGKESGDLVGPNWQTVVHPDDLPSAGAAWLEALQTGNIYQTEFRLIDKDGIYRWHLARAQPFTVDGKIVKWFGTNTDIDQQKQLQRQKDEFLGIASHELKTPVTSIKAYTQVLGAMLTKEGEHKKAGMVLRMDSQINRLTNLIGDLLDVTKINSGRLQFNKTWFNFNESVKATNEDLQQTTQKHQLITEIEETGSVYADKDRIDQVLTNLVTNAIKYSPHSDKIVIKTKLHDKEVNVCVQDFGIGIPADKKDRVFEQFYRVSGAKQHTFPGLGLGLYISSEIIKREGGRLWVESTEGKGSTFCFTLPVDQRGKQTGTIID